MGTGASLDMGYELLLAPVLVGYHREESYGPEALGRPAPPPILLSVVAAWPVLMLAWFPAGSVEC